MEKFSKKNYFGSVNSQSGHLTNQATHTWLILEKGCKNGRDEKKIEKSVVNVLCSSKNGSIFAADFAAHVLLTVDAHALVKSRV